LQNGEIAGAGLDVFATEPLPPDSPLWDMPNVIMTPHVAGDITDNRDRATRFFCDNLRRYLAGEPLHNVVDPARGY
ncbi:MAG: D-2-hydroxyacid dehydrogenase, partial [Chloroflexi bacterium]|nr:D-2-hydroxyacid dehydrogenase [Chloroflexota bacterium]